MNKNKFNISNKCPKNQMKTNEKGYYNLYPIFSFKNYICSDKYFSEENSNENRHSLYKFFKNIQKFSNITWGAMRQDPKHFHFYEFTENLPELKNYKNTDLDYFKIMGLEKGRFIGFFDNNNTFNILLYDSQHKSYKRK